MSILTESYELPESLQQQITAAQESGLYASEAALISDAVRTLLAARPDLRLATACRLYERGDISLGKAADMADIDIVEMKAVLRKKGIDRTAPESLDKIVSMARVALDSSGRQP